MDENRTITCEANETAEDLRYIIPQMIDNLTDTQMNSFLTLLRQWLLEEGL